jgi:hypothetical protein
MTQHALLWSKQLNALHIEPLERTLSLNRESYRDDEPVFYAPIAVGTLEQMQATADSIRGTLVERDAKRRPRNVNRESA